jgi:glycosyltransferase involved in cell wall biosynthesis
VPPPRPDVTCTIICQNEARGIRDCLDSVRWCTEVVVVDGGSTDDTPALARAWGARVLHNRWPGFRAQKQFALDAATSPWVLNLDADERVTNELAARIDQVLRAVPPDVDGFTIPRLVGYLGRWWWRGGWYPRPILRLVRRDTVTWGGTDPHERAEVRGRVRALHEPLLHYTYLDTADHLRAVRFLTQDAVAQVPRGRRTGVLRFLVQPSWRLLRSWVLTGGVFNGLPGLLVAATDAFYAFLRCAAVWERDRGPC